jgi:hypothetical protein
MLKRETMNSVEKIINSEMLVNKNSIFPKYCRKKKKRKEKKTIKGTFTYTIESFIPPSMPPTKS